MLRFVYPGGTNNLFVPRGTFLTRRRGGDKHFSHTGEGQRLLYQGGTQTFLRRGGHYIVYVVGGGGHDDVDEEMYVSEANFLVSKASKLCAGARNSSIQYCRNELLCICAQPFFQVAIKNSVDFLVFFQCFIFIASLRHTII